MTTLDPGSLATVTVIMDGSDVHFTFGIPRGPDGTAGPQGMPGEVTSSQLDTAISGTSQNSHAVATLDSSFADPEMEGLGVKVNELILALRQ